MTLGGILLWFGGAQAVAVGLLAFAGKVWVDRTGTRQKAKLSSQIEALRAETAEGRQRLQHILDRQLQVHALQFKKELEVYEEIWRTLIEMAKAVTQLRPPLDYYNPKETEDERKRDRLTQLNEAGQSFLDQMNKERPFYAPTVHEKLVALQSEIRKEAIEYQYDDQAKNREYWEKALANSKSIQTLIDETCEAIRVRIGVISAV
jgi:hypothetical protein